MGVSDRGRDDDGDDDGDGGLSCYCLDSMLGQVILGSAILPILPIL
jgi:hypothetical protein